MKNTRLLLASMIAAALAAAPVWSAALTTPGDYAITGTTSAASPQLAGVVLADTTTSFTVVGAAGSLSGTVQSRVLRSTLDGTLDFYWRITPTSGSDGIAAFRLIGFDGVDLNADWRSDGQGSVAPTTARYLGSGAVNFLFENDKVGVGSGSYFFFLDTDATNFTQNGQFDLLYGDNLDLSDIYQTYAPAAVPVPATAWLLGSGVIGLVGLRRRRC